MSGRLGPSAVRSLQRKHHQGPRTRTTFSVRVARKMTQTPPTVGQEVARVA